MSKALLVLKKAREKITDPSKWTKGSFAKTRNGFQAKPESTRACSWCSIGALRSAAFDLNINASGIAQNYLNLSLPYGWINVVSFNDSTTTDHSSVLRMFDDAIFLAQKETIHV
jgi:hypothetical protein